MQVPVQTKSVDKRVERSRAAVLAEAYRQLSAGGIAGLNIDEVSRISGVAKTTIYRHWPSRSALVIDACSGIGVESEAPDTGTLRGDLLAVAQCLAEQLRSCSWTSIYPSILDAAERDPEIAAMQSELHAFLTKSFRMVIERPGKENEMPPGLNAEDLIAEIVSPLFYRRWFSKDAIDGPLVQRIIDRAFR